MKMLASMLTAIALLTGSTVQAQTNGQGSAAGTRTATDNGLAWGIGLGALVVLGVVVGIVAASASEKHSYSQH